MKYNRNKNTDRIAIWLSLITMIFLIGISCSNNKVNEPEIPDSVPHLLTVPILHFFALPKTGPETKMLEIWTDRGETDWNLTCDAPWLSFSRSHGTASHRKTTITIKAHTSDLKKGLHSTTIYLLNEIDGSVREIITDVFISDAQAKQPADIKVITVTDEELQNIITFRQVEASFVRLNKGPYYSVKSHPFYPDDLCILVSGNVENHSGRKVSFTVRSVGYDKNGNEIAWSLQVDPYTLAAGVSILNIEPYSTASYELWMGLSGEISQIEIITSGILNNQTKHP